MNLQLLLLSWVVLCFELTTQTNVPGAKVSLELISFQNPKSLDLNGNCCEKTCTRCDYYFEICLKDSPNGKCHIDATTRQWNNVNDIVFPKGSGALGKYSNPLVTQLNSWKGRLLVSIKVMDDDVTFDDLVDKYLIDRRVTPTAGIVQQTWTTLTVKGIPSTLKIRYSVQCNRDYYGPSCTKYCLARDDHVGHYTCDLKTGSKVCRDGWFGADCLTYCVPKDDDVNGHYRCEKNTGKKICLNSWYGSTCKTYCNARNDSRSGYTCDSTGKKICLTSWYPSNICDVFCLPKNDSTSGYNCDLTTGQKTCLTGWYGPECDCSPRNDSLAAYYCNKTSGQRVCYPGWHGKHCNVYCLARNDSFGHYRCNPSNGAKECWSNWFGEKCDVYCPPKNATTSNQNTMCSVNNTIICAHNWYGSNCSVHCEPRDDDVAHYTCNKHNGQKVCSQGWYGENCTTHCIPRDMDWFGHYNCDDEGNKVCHQSWYGPDCGIHCTPQNSSLGNYICTQDGTRTCLENWYGTKCLRYCKARDDTQGRYRCSPSGDRMCLENWYGDNCTVYCVPRDSHMGHYTCDPLTGQEVCLGWTGADCKEGVVTEPTTSSQAPTPDASKNTMSAHSSLSELSLALILGGVMLMICLTVGVAIIACSRRQTNGAGDNFPYFRYKNTSTQGSLERAADVMRDEKKNEPDKNRQSRVPNLLSQYDDDACKTQRDNVVINLQEISWNDDGSRNVDDKLVMYNNPLFIKRQSIHTEPRPQDPRVDPVTGLRDNSDWVAIFDSYRFEYD